MAAPVFLRHHLGGLVKEPSTGKAYQAGKKTAHDFSVSVFSLSQVIL
jgi:hypothetical protein